LTGFGKSIPLIKYKNAQSLIKQGLQAKKASYPQAVKYYKSVTLKNKASQAKI
jgi:hypothetical protein